MHRLAKLGIMSHQSFTDRFRTARSDPSLAVLEGFHPLKHAVRFGAELIEVVCLDIGELEHMASSLAPDISSGLHNLLVEVPAAVFDQLAPVPPPTGVIALARRPGVSLTKMVNDPAPAPVVLLENPRNLLNIGAGDSCGSGGRGGGSHNHRTPGPLAPDCLDSRGWLAIRPAGCADCCSSQL